MKRNIFSTKSLLTLVLGLMILAVVGCSAEKSHSDAEGGKTEEDKKLKQSHILDLPKSQILK